MTYSPADDLNHQLYVTTDEQPPIISAPWTSQLGPVSPIQQIPRQKSALCNDVIQIPHFRANAYHGHGGQW